MGLICAPSMKRFSFVIWAASRDSSSERESVFQMGQEYVMSSDRKAANISLLMS